MIAFAGIWDRWKDPSGNWIKTRSILTTTPNAVTATVHDRMPVILDPDSYDLWLDPGMRDVGAASDLLKSHDARLMRCYPVSTRINSVAHDDEQCSGPLARYRLRKRRYLDRDNVLRLPAFGALGHVELHLLPFLQALEAARLNG